MALLTRSLVLTCGVSAWLSPPWSGPFDLAEKPQWPELAEEAVPQERIVGPHDALGDGSEQYSGYLNAGADTAYFFILAKRRATAPQDAPLLLWLNGGPGCSSLMATVQENGPSRVVQQGEKVATVRRAQSWTEAADVLYVEQPAGVGFSRGPPVSDEAEVSTRMLSFLRRFFGKFEELRRQRFFIFGESYGGHYVPAITTRLIRSGIKVDGAAMGNGLVNVIPQFETYPEMAFTGGVGGSLGHGIVNRSVFEDMKLMSPKCSDAFRRARSSRSAAETASAFDICNQFMTVVVEQGLNPYDLRMQCGGKDEELCYPTDNEQAFFDDPEVRMQLGLDLDARNWSVCSKPVFGSFMESGDTVADMEGDVAELLGAGVPVLLYHGDTDYVCHWLGGKKWASELTWQHGEAWQTMADQSFVVRGRSAGRVRSFGGLTFLQIYNSGHMVPMDQPDVALAMVRQFLALDSSWRSAAGTSLPAEPALAGNAPALLLCVAVLSTAAWLTAARRQQVRNCKFEEPLCSS